MERPGRPRLAVLLSAALFVVVTALAWGLVHYRQRGIEVPLGNAQTIGGWPLRVRLPDGWTATTPKTPGTRIGVQAQEPGGRGRVLAVVRAPSLPTPGLPSRALAELTPIVAEFAEAEAAQRVSYDVGRFGPLPGGQAAWRVADRAGRALVVLGAFTKTPRGEVFGILLRCQAGVEAYDVRFLQQVAASVELDGLGVTGDVASAALSLGLRFDGPTGAVAVVSPEGPVRSLALFSDPGGKSAWTIDVRLIPLAPGRNPKDLLADIGRNIRNSAEPSEALEAVSLSGRQAWREVIAGAHGEIGIQVWMVPMAAGLGVCLNGWSEGGASEMSAACEKIAGSLAATGEAGLDMAAARTRGADVLGQIRDKGLDAWLGAWEQAQPVFLRWRDDEVTGYTRQRITRTSDAARPWRTELEQAYGTAAGDRVAFRSAAQLDEKGTAYTMAAILDQTAGGMDRMSEASSRERYEEERRGGEDTVRKTLEMERNTYGRKLTVNESFVCDPVTDIVGWLAASDPQKRPVLVWVTGWLEPALVSQILHPLGLRPVPGADPPQEALAVMVQIDSRLDVYTYYYDKHGVTVAVDLGGEMRLLRCTEEEFRQRFPTGIGRGHGRRGELR